MDGRGTGAALITVPVCRSQALTAPVRQSATREEKPFNDVSAGGPRVEWVSNVASHHL